MVVNGVEVHRKAPGGQAVKKSVKLTAGEKVPFKITYLTTHANGLGWMIRMDVPGTLNTLVRGQGKIPLFSSMRPAIGRYDRTSIRSVHAGSRFDGERLEWGSNPARPSVRSLA